MLVLSRGRNETVLVGDAITVTVVNVHVDGDFIAGAQVHLGFQAPRDVLILRQEVAERSVRRSSHRPSKPKPPPARIPGTVRPLPGAKVRLRIQAPPKTSVHHSKASTGSSGSRQLVESFRTESKTADGDERRDQLSEIVFDCQKNDSILVGKNLMIAITNVVRFVMAEPPPEYQASRPHAGPVDAGTN